jgi:hypothetical protein
MLFFRNVVRGFSLVPHDPEGSHYRILKASTSQGSRLAMTNEGGRVQAPPLRINVERGFSLVPHDPEGSHYRILKASTSRGS